MTRAQLAQWLRETAITVDAVAEVVAQDTRHNTATRESLGRDLSGAIGRLETARLRLMVKL